MNNMGKYIKNNRILREKIVSDIVNQKLNKTELDELLKNTDIKNSFFGKDYERKISQNQWNREYLEKISYASIAEYFNEDYLIYLYKVTQFVNQKEKEQKKFKIIMIGIILLIIVLVLFMKLKN